MTVAEVENLQHSMAPADYGDKKLKEHQYDNSKQAGTERNYFI